MCLSVTSGGGGDVQGSYIVYIVGGTYLVEVCLA
jgi:hypothetical protein